MIVSAGEAGRDYVPIDIVSAVAIPEGSWFSTGSGPGPEDNIDTLKESLKEKASALRADAVIHCRFEYVSPDALGGNEVKMIAYGTAVRFTD